MNSLCSISSLLSPASIPILKDVGYYEMNGVLQKKASTSFFGIQTDSTNFPSGVGLSNSMMCAANNVQNFVALDPVILPAVATGCSICLWIYNTTIHSIGTYFLLSAPNKSSQVGLLSFGGKYTLRLWDVVIGNSSFFQSSVITLNAWTHVAIVMGTTPTIYINGISASLSNTNYTYAPATYVNNFLFKDTNNWGPNISNICDFRIYDRKLSVQEINTLAGI
jgi:hypothetical protein